MSDNYIVGTCDLMCPKKEAFMRQKENLLHKFEIKAGTESHQRPEFDPHKIVKCFNRSAAGSETANPTNLRPFPVLMKTIRYLYEDIFPMHVEKPLMVYNFMFDRFRAVRQDAVIQNLSEKENIQLLEPIVRFLIYFGYLLVDEDVSNYDSYINSTHTQECMKRLLICYDNCSDTNQLNRWDIESAYILFNIGNIKPLTRGFSLAELCDSDIYKECVKISCLWYLKNYIRVFKSIKELPPLLICVLNTSIPEMRKFSLQIMSYAYSSQNSSYPVSHLKGLLLYESDYEVLKECKHFNITSDQNNIKFLKKDFNLSIKSKQGTRLKWVDKLLLNCNLVEVLCFGKK